MNKYKKFSFIYVTWITILILIPLLVMVYIAFSDMTKINFSESTISFEHFNIVFSNTYFNATITSFKLAFIATIISLLIGYPIAYIISNIKHKNKFILILLFVLPMWTNLLLRLKTINSLLEKESILEQLFGFTLNVSGSEIAVIIAMVLIYLPFMIFPIYTVLEKKDPGLIEAAYDLGANPITTFFKVTLPLSVKGITSGVTMVFLPCVMGFTIPYVISNGTMLTIGTIIQSNFEKNLYNIGSLASLMIIIVIFGAMILMNKIDSEGETLL